MNYITYGHTDYIDILNVHANYIKDLGHHTLFINDSAGVPLDILQHYDDVAYYDDSLPYAGRMLQCMNQINYDYFLLILDTDIVLNVDTIILEWFVKFLKSTDYDRIDLKYTSNLQSSLILDIEDWKQVKEIGSSTYLVRAENPHDYIYNLNPSIWKRESFMDLLTTFPEKNYRNIEFLDVQEYCQKFNVFKMHSKNFLECGWFRCLELFKFLKITHGGRLLPLNNEFMTPSGQSYVDCYQDYLKMYAEYNLKDVKLKHFLG
jgi:hypothetical protein